MTFLLMLAMTISAQVTSVTGTVTSSDDGQPVVGATVTVKGTKAVTVTDLNGKFTITSGIGGGQNPRRVIRRHENRGTATALQDEHKHVSGGYRRGRGNRRSVW